MSLADGDIQRRMTGQETRNKLTDYWRGYDIRRASRTIRQPAPPPQKWIPAPKPGRWFGVPATIHCPNPCRVKARLDGSGDELSNARYPGNHRNMLFFSPDTLPFAVVSKASRLEVEVETKEYGWRVLTFDVRGFEIDRLKAGK